MNFPHHVIVTGCAGFIGSHLVERLLSEGMQVTGIDNFDPFYDQAYKKENMDSFARHPRFRFIKGDIQNESLMQAELNDRYDQIVHLAAKAGVRPSLMDPMAYQVANVLGTQSMLNIARSRKIDSFIFASSSSVYGDNQNLPWKEDEILLPLNPYASTKLANEQMGYVYSKTFGIQCIGLRFFTVYGPRQRPDLAIRKFTDLINAGQTIPVYGDGTSERDFTFITDIIDGIRAAMQCKDRFEVFNLGNNRTISMSYMLEVMGKRLEVMPKIQYLPWQPGEMRRTWADISKSKEKLGFEPKTSFEKGFDLFVRWDTARQAF